MCVAEDADIRSLAIQKGQSVLCEPPTFIQNMTDGDAPARQCDDDLRWKPALLVPVDITGNGGDRSDLLQLFNHRSPADIPGMKYVIDASEVSPDRRIEQAVGICNHSDLNGSVPIHGIAAG